MGAFYPIHQRSEAARNLPPMNDIGILEFYELIGERPPESTFGEDGPETGHNRRSPQETQTEEEKAQTEPQHKEQVKDHAFETQEKFKEVLESCLKAVKGNGLMIYDGKSPPKDNPSATKARPDFALHWPEYLPPPGEGKIFWGSIEMAIEYGSRGKSLDTQQKQAATYAMYLLEARPDLVSVLGLLVEPDGLVFFFCNACGINKLRLLDEQEYLPLLSAAVKYLNGGQKQKFDSTLIRISDGTFDVSFPGSEDLPTFPSCSLRYLRDPFGRRPHVFINKSYDPKNGVAVKRVIKDQYIRKGRRWIEKQILDTIHAQGTYPAAVRLLFSSKIPHAECGDRMRVRICLEDYGEDFLSLKTPRELIYALYDLLEVTRGLFSEFKILHRDISPWNIMIRDPAHHVETRTSATPVFIRHLLDKEGRKPKHEASIFLIDLGYSRDLNSSEPCDTGRTGTPMFIARAVQAGAPLPPPSPEELYFPRLPQVPDIIREVYESSHPQRMEEFDGASAPQYGPCNNPPPSSPFQHKLAHDGESEIWSAFWWAIQAYPEGASGDDIDPVYWNALMPQYDGSRTGLPKHDRRKIVLNALIDRDTTIFHPGYGGLLNLFQSIARAILVDYHWAEDPIRQRPDFVHEILQRIILNFVVENEDAKFMDAEKAMPNRNVGSGTSHSHLSIDQSSLVRRPSAPSGGQKRKWDEPTHDSVASTNVQSSHGDGGDGGGTNEEETHRFAKKLRMDK